MKNNDYEIQAVKIFNKYLIDSKTNAVAIKFSIKYKQNLFLKFFFSCFRNIYKKYYLKVSYANGDIKHFKISYKEKEKLKDRIQTVNFYLGNLEVQVFDKSRIKT